MWKGASPNFSIKAMVMSAVGMGWASWLIDHCPLIHAFVSPANSSKAAAAAWTKKYFVAASTDRGC